MSIVANAPPDPDAPQAGVRRRPTLLEAIVPVLVMALLLGFGYGLFHLRIEMLLLAAAGTAALVALRLGCSWRALEGGIVEAITRAMPPTLIMIVVGMMISSWIAAGTIPMLMSFGIALIHPTWFLVTACIVCSVVSVLTGTSYGTAGTIGVAFIGIAQGLDISAGMAAGAVVAGAYFGDKISPFSDTTNLAAAVARTNIFDHILHMLWTTVPAYLLGLGVYALAGYSSAAEARSEQVMLLRVALEEAFVFHWLLLVPALVVLVLAFLKKPPLPAMVLSSVVAIGCAVAVQGASLGSTFEACVLGYRADTGSAQVDLLLSRGGMQTMMDVILVALCAFAFAGIMQQAGMLAVILDRIRKIARTTGRLIAATVSASVMTALITGSSYLSVIIPGELFAGEFRDRGLAAKNLSRTTEDSGTVVVPLVPWSMAGVFMAGTLGVPTLEYAPWAVFCYTGFAVALLYGFTGFAVAPRVREDETRPGS